MATCDFCTHLSFHTGYNQNTKNQFPFGISLIT